MVVYEGKAVFEGIAIGKLYVYTKQEQTVKRVKVDDCEAEKKRYEKARETAMEQPGVQGVELLRTRMFGNRVYVDLEIAGDPGLSLAAAHEIAERVHDAIEQTYPDVKHIMVHVNPAKEQGK
jgi:divalent metal cation (Fe/Co/Zn/Cd) transporter